MVLVNGGFLHCTDKEFLVNSSLKTTKKMCLEQSQKSGERSRAILALLFGGVPLKGYVASLDIFSPVIKKSIVGISSD